MRREAHLLVFHGRQLGLTQRHRLPLLLLELSTSLEQLVGNGQFQLILNVHLECQKSVQEPALAASVKYLALCAPGANP